MNYTHQLIPLEENLEMDFNCIILDNLESDLLKVQCENGKIIVVNAQNIRELELELKTYTHKVAVKKKSFFFVCFCFVLF